MSALSARHALTYFYSGTGNSHRVARWIHAAAQAGGLDSTLYSVEQARPAEDLRDDADQLLALCFPTHGFTAPWHLIKFALRLPAGRGKPALVCASRAGMVFGPWHPPGMSASATFLIALLLWLRGYRPRGVFSVNMPSNWYSLHPMQKPASHARILAHSQAIVRRRIARLLDGGRIWWTLNNLWELSLGLALAPISLLYLVAGRIGLAKLFFANARCTRCGLCARDCPVGAIRMRGDPPRPFWRYSCESCMRCAAFCPSNAIEAGHSWAVLVYFVTTVPAGSYLLRALAPTLGLSRGLAEGWPGRLLDLLWFYPSLLAAYALFWWLLRFDAVNGLFARTTLTHYWGRYREPGTRLRHLRGRRGATRPDDADAPRTPAARQGPA